MSEYQYYEFLAVDRPLSKEQLAELRTLSTRAIITPTGFQNVYNFGDFRGSPERLMERYFDAFVYVANWGTRWFMLRLPQKLLNLETTSRYVVDDVVEEGLSAWVAGENVILSFRSEEEGADWEEGEGWMAALVPLRSDLASGDLRSLYLGWLAGIQGYVWDDDANSSDDEEWDEESPDENAELLEAVEPPVPQGLGKLSASLETLADFLRLDPDLLAVAAELSGPGIPAPSRAEWERWLRELPAAEKDAYFLRLIADGDTHAPAELRQRFQRHIAAARPARAQAATRRTVGELLRLARERAERRRRAEAEHQARERARIQREQGPGAGKAPGRPGWPRGGSLAAGGGARGHQEAARIRRGRAASGGPSRPGRPRQRDGPVRPTSERPPRPTPPEAKLHPAAR